MRLMIVQLLGALTMISCNPFYTDSDKCTYNTFRRANTVSKESINEWIHELDNIARFDSGSRVILSAIRQSKSADKRQELADLYLEIYARMASGRYGRMTLAEVDGCGRVRMISDRKVDVRKHCLASYYNRLVLYMNYGGRVPSSEEEDLLRKVKKIREFSFEEVYGSPKPPGASKYWR